MLRTNRGHEACTQCSSSNVCAGRPQTMSSLTSISANQSFCSDKTRGSVCGMDMSSCPQQALFTHGTQYPVLGDPSQFWVWSGSSDSQIVFRLHSCRFVFNSGLLSVLDSDRVACIISPTSAPSIECVFLENPRARSRISRYENLNRFICERNTLAN